MCITIFNPEQAKQLTVVHDELAAAYERIHQLELEHSLVSPSQQQDGSGKPSRFSHAPFDFSFFITIVGDGFGTDNERTLEQLFPQLASRLPIETCFAAYLLNPDECRDFKAQHQLNGLAPPLVVITEENPFSGKNVAHKVVFEIGKLPSPNEVRMVISSVTEQVYDDDFMQQAKKGELLRKIERGLGKYGGPVKDCLKLIGFM